MITSRALVERNPKTMRLISFAADERPRSLQLYGVDPATVAGAVRMIAEGDRADHVDLNFGCPVPKVTRRGGGAALPWHTDLFAEIVAGAVTAADGAFPVSVKMRIGVDDGHRTYREASLRAQDAGVAYVALHGRTAADFYSGTADWAAIADLVELLDIPVLGNGDIWEADDALRMIAETGCAGVVVGRGCLGRPWLFADLVAAFEAGRSASGRSRGSSRDDAQARRAARGLARRGPWPARVPQACRLVSEGVRGRQRYPCPARAGFDARSSWMACWPSSIRRCRSRRMSSAGPAGAPPARDGWRCQQAGSSRAAADRSRPALSWTTPAAEARACLRSAAP
jgi:tRNA-dihydrouridine synthase